MQNTQKSDSELLVKHGAAEFLHLKDRTLDLYVQQRKIPYFKLGNAKNSPVRFKRSDLMTWLESHKVEAI